MPNLPMPFCSSGLYRFSKTPGMAEREGFEPPEGRPSTVFKTAAFDRSATSPDLLLYGYWLLITDFPAINGRKASGITIEPSFC